MVSSLKLTSKRYIVKIPKNVLVIYSNLNGHLLLKKDNKVVHTKTLFRLEFSNSNFFRIIPEVVNSNNSFLLRQNKVKKLLNTQVSIIKKYLIDVSTKPYRKLIFVGLGYKFFLIENNLRLLRLKLGYSHDIYVKVPSNIDLKWYGKNSIYVSGLLTSMLSNFVRKIKDYKVPDPYLGKGILFVDENIILKKGKQV